MGIFNSLPSSVSEKADKTVIAKGTHITGTIDTDALLMIDGNIEGEVQSTSDVSVGLNGRFIGQMNAKHILVSGSVEGDLECDRLEVLRSGVVNGNVVVRELTIEQGGRFFGQSREAGKPEKAEKPADAAEPATPEKPVGLASVKPLRAVKEA